MAFRTVSTSLRVQRRKEKQRGYYQRGMRAAKAFLSFYSPPKPRALLPIRLVDTARDVNEMQRGIRLPSHVMSVFGSFSRFIHGPLSYLASFVSKSLCCDFISVLSVSIRLFQALSV